ncbi:hypothetical protein EXIGLDRAFT_727111 [Exidia glandulosa HHB12029]|uniref:Uncharacterized protein n=1 Tax=Exidia glandulosa HHB12029 TaxID=1314781 RepID=A0A165M5F6_EXIGL|nr:hypothetical protein EXIGLDRAFT_727111 [Exidia glandulosa HHB12029]
MDGRVRWKTTWKFSQHTVQRSEEGGKGIEIRNSELAAKRDGSKVAEIIFCTVRGALA